ncbi:MAG: electron transfer flavoprotein subunit alpha/FixB family protein [Candidatus Izimaplasma sp.]|nr:electron transfer flavoprotein subunit alpha/FixB family protein [Candidatus Izimaplasma bacterium]
MGYIKVNNELMNKEIAENLMKICPFNAFDYEDGLLNVNAGCKICKICVKKGPKGVCELVEEEVVLIDKSKYKGICVFVEQHNSKAHRVAWELIGKAEELAKVTNEEVYAIVIGSDVDHIANKALKYGVDKVFQYDTKELEHFNIERYTNIIEHFINKNSVNILLMGSTHMGRSLAPRVAARMKTGLTADCTSLELTPEGDLLQIRPAFGGNIMAKINTLNHRPQLATIRYKMFQEPEIGEPKGQIIKENLKGINLDTKIRTIKTILKQDQGIDISDAEIIIAVGRAFKKQKDLELLEPLRKRFNAQLACTRPLIENGWFDAKKQIGLSGRTVKPKLIISIGISGAVQYIEGMKESELIISINSDPDNKLFDVSHYSIVGDLYEILPKVNEYLAQIIEE